MSEPTTTPPAAPAGVAYKTDATGRTTRTPPGGAEEHVANIDEAGMVTYVSLATKQKAPAILRHYKSIGRTVTGTQVAAQPTPQEALNVLGATTTPPAVEKAVAAAQAASVAASAPATSIPPPPPLDKMRGDKTPEYVEWLRLYQPEEFIKRFGVGNGGRELDVRLKQKVRRPNGLIEEEFVTKRCLVATRKTVLTEKIE